MKNLSLAALLMAGAAMTACSSSSDDIIEQPANPTEPKVYTMVIKASKGGETTTRALQQGSDGIDAYWIGGEDGEKIEVGQYNYTTEKYDIIGEATAAPSENGNTTITAELDYAPDPDKDLYFFLGGSTPDYTGQVGLLTGTNSISEKYDYASDCLGSGSYTVDEINKKIIPGDYEPLEFGAAKQAIIKFTLKDKANNEAISPSAFTVTDGTSTVKLTSIPTTTYDANGDGVLYVAFPPGAENTTITLTATVGGDTYTYTTSSLKTFYRGQYYEITVKMTKHVPSLADAFVDGNTTVFDFTSSHGDLTLSATYNSGLFGAVTKGGTMDEMITSASMTKDGNNLVITVTVEISFMGSTITKTGSMTINTVNNTYSWSNATVGGMITLSAITIGGNSITPLPYKMAADAATEDVGKLICTDGHIHAKNADATCTKDRVAMIAYVGAASDFTNGLAIALKDVTNGSLRWDNSGSNNDGKTAADWCSAWNNTNTSKKVEGGTWRLPSIVDWQYILVGCGASGSVSENPTPGSYMSYSGLASKLSTAGGDALSSNYWSSTEYNDDKAWYLSFTGGDNALINTGYKTGTCYARACLAF